MSTETKAQIVYVDFDGQQKHHTVAVCNDAESGVYLWGACGCGKTRPTVEAAAREYLGGRVLVSIQ